ncbi:MAG: response regulator [Deltaproteobacteria bacterium]|nr:response regulator [Deltaproteobacteria bacterium]MBW2086918.1 response regulator [Deltaproteobacteria bacterium]
MENFRVLIVDDEIDFLETIVNRLKKRDFKAAGVTSGEEAIELVQEQSFDVIILDIKMPGGMDGIEALREIRKIQPLAQVILLTGHAAVETSIEGLKLGAFDYLLKPIKFEELLKKMMAAYEKKSEHDRKIRDAKIQELIRDPLKIFDKDD